MPLLHNLSTKSNAALAGFHLDKLEKLLTGEIPGMRSHKVEETGLLLRIAEIPERFGIDYNRIVNFIGDMNA